MSLNCPFKDRAYSAPYRVADLKAVRRILRRRVKLDAETVIDYFIVQLGRDPIKNQRLPRLVVQNVNRAPRVVDSVDRCLELLQFLLQQPEERVVEEPVLCPTRVRCVLQRRKL